MGIIPKPDEYGSNCSRCFAPGETPKYFKLFISGMSIGDDWSPGDPPPPNGYFDCEQHPADACTFRGTDGETWEWGFTWYSGYSIVDVTRYHAQPVFYAKKFVECLKGFGNKYSEPLGRKYYGGFAHITTSANMSSMIQSLTPMIDPDPRMELFPIDEDIIAVRYAGKRDATNIMIKIDTNP